MQRRNVEILKIRFGEAALQVCEVMLRDMTDSRRIDQHVQSQKAVSCYIHNNVRSRYLKHRVPCILRSYLDISGPHSSPVTWSCPGNFRCMSFSCNYCYF